jgi:hypothetical protein
MDDPGQDVYTLFFAFPNRQPVNQKQKREERKKKKKKKKCPTMQSRRWEEMRKIKEMEEDGGDLKYKRCVDARLAKGMR